MTWLLALMALGLAPTDGVVRDWCDLTEVNHFYDGDCRKVFQQIIWWDWHAEEGCYHVAAWRMVKDGQPLPISERGRYVTRWRDGEALREVVSAQFRETWGHRDPEMIDRVEFLKDSRRELSRPLHRDALRIRP